MSALLKAVYQGNLAKLEKLVAEGADITERYEDCLGVLLHAASFAQYTAMRWLLNEARASMIAAGHQAHYTVWKNLNLHNQTRDAAAFSA
jgi:hypothetical protein